MVQQDKPKMYFSTQMVEDGKPILDFDQFFLRQSLYKYGKSDLEHLLGIQYHRLKTYVSRKKAPLNYAHARNREPQSKSNESTVTHIRRYHALTKVEGACKVISDELNKRAYHQCVIFGLSSAVMQVARLYLSAFNPAIIYPGSKLRTVNKYIKNFREGRIGALIVSVQAGFGLNLDCTQYAFFIEESLGAPLNVRVLDQMCGPKQKKEIYVRNFCLKDPVDMRVSELIRLQMIKLAYRHRTDGPKLPERFL